MKDFTEETRSSEQLVDGTLLKVFRDEICLPDGAESVREWIDHPGAAAVVPILADGTTLLVRQYRYAPRQHFLEVPAGKLDAEGDDPGEVAARELKEETGWTARRLTRLGSFFPGVGYSNEEIHLFLAEDLAAGEPEPGEGEFLEVVRLPFEEAVARARRGALRDLKTVGALLLAAAHRAGAS